MSSPLRVAHEAGKRDSCWPEADVVVVAGVPGGGLDEELDSTSVPTTTTDIVKLLRGEGLTVKHHLERDQRREISLNSAEYWMPVLIFGHDLLANAGGDLFADAIGQLIPSSKRRSSRLNVEFGEEQADGTVRYFKADGDADDVLQAMSQFGKEQT